MADPCDIGATRNAGDEVTADVDRGAELELEAGFGRKLEVFLPAGRHRGAGHAADHRADRGSFAAARDTPDDGAEAGAATDLAARLLPSPLPLLSM